MKRILLAVLAVLTASCSILEDRSECPYFVVLDLDYYSQRSSSASFDYTQWLDGVEKERSTKPYNAGNHLYEIPIKVGMVDIRCLSDFGKNSERLDEKGVNYIIPLGEQHIPFYGLFKQCFVQNEDIYIKGETLYKQFCNLKFKLSRVPYHDYTVSIISDVCGFNAKTLEPVKGGFQYDWKEIEEYYNVCLPRQLNGDNLKIIIRNAELAPHTPDITIELGKFLKGEQYNWAANDLCDIYAQIDAESQMIVVQILD